MSETADIAAAAKVDQLIEVYKSFAAVEDLSLFVAMNPQYREMVSFLRGALRQAKKRAVKHRREISISIENLLVMLLMQDNRCAVSGATFSLHKLGESSVRPFAPSIDRINSQDGYVPGNVRLTCHCVNLMMNEWGDAVFHELAKRVKESNK